MKALKSKVPIITHPNQKNQFELVFAGSAASLSGSVVYGVSQD